MITKKDYRSKMLLKCDELKARVCMLENAIVNSEVERKLALYEILERIKIKQVSVNKILIKLNSTPDSLWENIKLNFENLWHELHHTFDYILK